MRLLNSHTLDFKNFQDASIRPPYAILSHTWGEDEVTYKEMLKHKDRATLKQGYRKIKYCAEQAIRDNLAYFWVDTCCIDKSSSAELSEAINSMFHWYKNAHICYAFLPDVGVRRDVGVQSLYWRESFAKSRWFTRGWTLQELLAPQNLHFFSSESWKPCGTKVELADKISQCTGIPSGVLTKSDYAGICVAERISWAAHRQTARLEDRAYSLLGLLNVNMPMLYGEGEKAFLRLQEEVVKKSTDMSIFAWTNEFDVNMFKSKFSGLLASSPHAFRGYRRPSHVTYQKSFDSEPYQMTNKGMSLRLKLTPEGNDSRTSVAILEGMVDSLSGKYIGVELIKIHGNQYARVRPDQLVTLDESRYDIPQALSAIYVPQEIEFPLGFRHYDRSSGVILRCSLAYKDRELLTLSVDPSENWNKTIQEFPLKQDGFTKWPCAKFKFTEKPSQYSGGFVVSVDLKRLDWPVQVGDLTGGWGVSQSHKDGHFIQLSSLGRAPGLSGLITFVVRVKTDFCIQQDCLKLILNVNLSVA